MKKNKSRFWKRFLRKKAALLSLFFIMFLILVAIFAYPLCTDDREDANTVFVELAAKHPGFEMDFLVKPGIEKEQRNFLSYLLHGKNQHEILIPIHTYKIQKDTMYYEKYIADGFYESLIEAKNNFVLENNKAKIIHRKFILGTDILGRDVYSRLLLGTRVSLSVGFIAVFLSIIIGVLLGCIAAYFGGLTDHIVQWFINVVWAIPTLLLVFAITFLLGKGFWQIFIAVGLTMWVGTARLIRGQVLSLKELEYIQVAKVMGFSNFRIILRHIIPNVAGPTIVLAASNFATAILIEAGLSFLGIGVQPPTSSWGLMIKEHNNFIISNEPFLAIVPGVAIMLCVLAFNILGNGLRDALDVKAQ